MVHLVLSIKFGGPPVKIEKCEKKPLVSVLIKKETLYHFYNYINKLNWNKNKTCA